MSERLGPPHIQPENPNRKLLIQLIPSDLIGILVTKWMGEGLTPQEQAKLQKLGAKIVRGERFIPNQEVPPVYESQRSKLLHAGEKIFPKAEPQLLL